ncbi:MAG: hypothetical protein A4E57_04315 [Syntrophorhabdaceae bacterium PtaU1.Bin034]|nr:MAG: hypothetical protein A4E57_04315 [Syntrophorhabdaceae bacterium PtaU1.Bin034]
MGSPSFSVMVISYIRSVISTASWKVPPRPTAEPNRARAGEAAMAKAPIPPVSVMALSPISLFASAWV